MKKPTSQYGYSSTSAWVAAGLMIVSALLTKHLELSGLIRVAVVLLPVPALVWMLVVLVRWVQRLDELQQRIQLMAMSIAYAGTALVVLTYGLLQRAGFPATNWAFVWPVMVGFYYLGGVIARRRYE